MCGSRPGVDADFCTLGGLRALLRRPPPIPPPECWRDDWRELREGLFVRLGRLLSPVVCGTDTPPPEEDEWAEAQTEAGETYYYHLVTGETAWDPPAEAFR